MADKIYTVCRSEGCTTLLDEVGIRRRPHLCRECRSAHEKMLWARRRAAGTIKKYVPIKRDRSASDAAYAQRPEVKARRAAQARERNRDPAQREKIEARWLTNHAIESGKLLKQPCEVCGDAKSEAHHDDYSKPLDVRWLCRKHHKEHHMAERTAA